MRIRKTHPKSQFHTNINGSQLENMRLKIQPQRNETNEYMILLMKIS